MVLPSYEGLLDAIDEVMTGIESEILTVAFEHWMERLEWMSKNNGDYYPPVGSFTFLECLSGTELLNLSRTPESSVGTLRLTKVDGNSLIGATCYYHILAILHQPTNESVNLEVQLSGSNTRHRI
jgi:hypothetical protein